MRISWHRRGCLCNHLPSPRTTAAWESSTCDSTGLLRQPETGRYGDFTERAAAQAQRDSPVEPAQVSPWAQAKAGRKRTTEGLPAQSLRTLLLHLGTLTRNYVTLVQDDQHEFPMAARPTALQANAFALLDVDPEKSVSSKLAS